MYVFSATNLRLWSSQPGPRELYTSNHVHKRRKAVDRVRPFPIPFEHFLNHRNVLHSFPRVLCALIIGINYKNRPQLRLKAAVRDSKAIREFVQTRLGVCDEQLLYLEEEQATRAAILEAFQQLAGMPGMRRGDAILIYYAGHGDKIKLSLSTAKSVESIVPYDCDWNKVYPIPDQTIGTLLAHIYKERGDNIASPIWWIHYHVFLFTSNYLDCHIRLLFFRKWNSQASLSRARRAFRPNLCPSRGCRSQST